MTSCVTHGKASCGSSFSLGCLLTPSCSFLPLPAPHTPALPRVWTEASSLLCLPPWGAHPGPWLPFPLPSLLGLPALLLQFWSLPQASDFIANPSGWPSPPGCPEAHRFNLSPCFQFLHLTSLRTFQPASCTRPPPRFPHFILSLPQFPNSPHLLELLSLVLMETSHPPCRVQGRCCCCGTSP